MAKCCEELPAELGRDRDDKTRLEFDQEQNLRKRIRELDFRKPTDADSWFAYQCTHCGQYWWADAEDTIRWGPDTIYRKVSRDELLKLFPELKLGLPGIE